ncbi:MAG TPA: hypothetical protein VKT99_04580 [Xanthobacteraceae bacterium]|nr:hypothetical protein [Xanthobacteraceae bacterium]
MDPDAKIIGRNRKALRDLLAGLAQQVHAPDEIRLVSGERGQDSVETSANRQFGVVFDPHGRVTQLPKTLAGFISYSGSPIVVGQSAPQHLREPRSQRFYTADCPRASDHFQVKLLQ